MHDHTVTETIASLRAEGKNTAIVWVPRTESNLFDVYLCRTEDRDLIAIGKLAPTDETSGYRTDSVTFRAVEAGAEHRQLKIVAQSNARLILPTGRALFIAA